MNHIVFCPRNIFECQFSWFNLSNRLNLPLVFEGQVETDVSNCILEHEIDPSKPDHLEMRLIGVMLPCFAEWFIGMHWERKCPHLNCALLIISQTSFCINFWTRYFDPSICQSVKDQVLARMDKQDVTVVQERQHVETDSLRVVKYIRQSVPLIGRQVVFKAFVLNRVWALNTAKTKENSFGCVCLWLLKDDLMCHKLFRTSCQFC